MQLYHIWKWWKVQEWTLQFNFEKIIACIPRDLTQIKCLNYLPEPNQLPGMFLTVDLGSQILFMKWICKGWARIFTISPTVDHYQHQERRCWGYCCEQLGNRPCLLQSFMKWPLDILGFGKSIHILCKLLRWHSFTTSILSLEKENMTLYFYIIYIHLYKPDCKSWNGTRRGHFWTQMLTISCAGSQGI